MDSQPELFEDKDLLKEISEAINKSNSEGAAKIQEYLEKEKNTPLNIAITGETGSGKSTFVNVFRGIDNRDEGAAPTGCVETTMKVTKYHHPNYPNVTLWDLPGVGTTKFPADKYLEHVKFEKFDFFIIISDTRFTENDVKLAKKIQKMGKKFYYVHSKIDHNLQDEKRSQRDFNKERTLKQIREDCIQARTYTKGYPVHMYEMLRGHDKDKPEMRTDWVFRMYQVTFGLDCKSLENLARTASVPLNDLREVMKSPLAAKELNKDLVIKQLSLSISSVALMAAEEGSRFIPIIGIPAAMGLSFISTYNALSTFLNILAEDAHRVFTKALGLNTAV